MRLQDQTDQFTALGHTVRIGPVESEPELSHGSRTGRKRHFRRIYIDGIEVARSQGTSLQSARYSSGLQLEHKAKKG